MAIKITFVFLKPVIFIIYFDERLEDRSNHRTLYLKAFPVLTCHSESYQSRILINQAVTGGILRKIQKFKSVLFPSIII